MVRQTLKLMSKPDEFWKCRNKMFFYLLHILFSNTQSRFPRSTNTPETSRVETQVSWDQLRHIRNVVKINQYFKLPLTDRLQIKKGKSDKYWSTRSGVYNEAVVI